MLTAASCFSDDPAQPQALAAGAPQWKTTATIGRTDLTTGKGKTAEITELVPRADRDPVTARLGTPVDGIAPLAVTSTAPTAGQTLKVPAYGRTKDEWAPLKLHTGAFSLDTVSAAGIGTTGTGGAAICKGDTGAPVVREVNGKAELVAIARQNNDLNLALVASDGQYHTMRYASGSWSPMTSLKDAIGNITGTSISAAPVDTDARFAVATNDNKVLLTARHADGTWAQYEYLDLTPIPGNHTGTVITSSL
ncbi:trypsin-like serine protease [Kitasatospora sp. NPDC048286]|uniref:trypsin-like serine protease n=1 Tax=Kitasatospora sp. NPDC048286 TaxID=3364047 RepID=UPI0037206351